MVSENEVKFEEALKEVFEKVKDFDGDIENKEYQGEYQGLLNGFIQLNVDLFLLLKTEDQRRLRHRLKILERIVDLKCKKFKINARD